MSLVAALNSPLSRPGGEGEAWAAHTGLPFARQEVRPHLIPEFHSFFW
jgi:hypothetical protein